MMMIMLIIMIENGWEGGLHCVTHTMAATWIGGAGAQWSLSWKECLKWLYWTTPPRLGELNWQTKQNRECTNCLKWYYPTQIVRQTLALIELSWWTAIKLSHLTFKIQMILKSPAPESQIEKSVQYNSFYLQNKMVRSCRKKIDEYH